MDKRLKVSIVAAGLLAAAGALHHIAVAPGSARVDRPDDGGRTGEVVVARNDHALPQFHQAAQMIFDVHWAAACMTEVGQAAPGRAEGHPECDLPDHKAAAVNAWLNEAEAQCMAEAGGALRP